MSWNLFGQYLDFIVACILIIQLIRLKLYSSYKALIVFVLYESVQAVLYVVLRHFAVEGKEFLDYRLLWGGTRWIAWVTEIWVVYALLIAILKQLPGILRFSLRFLNVALSLAVIISVLTIKPQYTASGTAYGSDWLGRFTNLNLALDRATAFGLLLAILSILTFVLFFPIRVPRNLAAISTGLCLALFVRISVILIKIYLPAVDSPLLGVLDQLVTVGCMAYWVFSLNLKGEETRATLGRAWHTVPQGHLVDQLEAINSALLRSRDEPKDQ